MSQTQREWERLCEALERIANALEEPIDDLKREIARQQSELLSLRNRRR